VPEGQDRFDIVVTLVMEPPNAGIVSKLTDPIAGVRVCRADTWTSTSLGTPMDPDEITVPERAMGFPLGAAFPNSGTRGI